MKKRVLICAVIALLWLQNIYAQNTYTNPVIRKYLADPSVIKANDGWFYVYATESAGLAIPIYKSQNLVDWTFVGSAFTKAGRPTFVKNGWLWAPDINYINGKYVLYYSMSVWGGEWECGIGVATSSSPSGPFKDHGKLFTSSEIGVRNSIDPCFFQDKDGKNYLFWGSFHGIYGAELSADGLRLKKETKFQISPIEGKNRTLVEGTMMVRRGDYYYFFASAGSCCNELNSTYHVVVARSKNIKGPYLNKAGKSIMDHFSDVVLQGSDKVKGPGHHSELIKDDKGSYWVLYHGYDVMNPSDGRLLFLDKVNWDKDGWPFFTGGKPSEKSVKPTFSATAINDVTAFNKTYTITNSGENHYEIHAPVHSSFIWSLYNICGERIKTGRSTEDQELWVNDIANGIYIVKVNGVAGKLEQKIIKVDR